MNDVRTARPSTERLRASPSFALNLTFDGRAFIARDSEPYEQYWLSERDRLLFTLFTGRRGATPDDAIARCLRATGADDSIAMRERLSRTVRDMRDAGVLTGSRDDTSRYDRKIVDAYLEHRPFPAAISSYLVERAGIGAASRVLDLAGGPGDLALALASVSADVSMMELSRGFLASAKTRAARLKVPFTAIHDSCNRLVHHDEDYDVVTVSQALHWLDDVQICRGVCRVLRANGSFFVIHSAIEMDDAHPLAAVLGNRSILGPKERRPFVDEVAPLLKRLTLLFDALDAPDVQRIDPTRHSRPCDDASTARIVPSSVRLFSQRRPMGIGFARAFLTPAHLAAAAVDPVVFWNALEARCDAATADEIAGTCQWVVLQFRRGGVPLDASTVLTQQVHAL